MNRSARALFLAASIAAAAGLLAAGSSPALAQDAAPEARRGLPQDWSNRHLLHTNPDTRDQAARKGTLAFEKWKQKNKNPRFAAQVTRKTRFVQTTKHRPFSPEQLQWANRHGGNPPPAAGPAMQRDWSNPLGAASGSGHAGVFPAKYQFDINATPSCANDFVVFTTNSSGATETAAATFASRTGTFTRNPSDRDTVTITNGAQTITLTARTNPRNATEFQIGGSNIITATNLANAIVLNGGTVGVTATSSGTDVTLTAAAVGASGNSIALAEGLRNFAWSTGTTSTTLAGGSGSAGQPTIVAFNNLYKTTCTGQVPATFWSYNAGTGSIADSSPVLSLDGAQVAFVQHTNPGNVASLVLLKWSNTASVGTIDAPTELATVTANVAPGAYRSCNAPCMTSITFSGSPNSTNSSPYYVYDGGDVLYVGDDIGKLHKFTGVFGGTPAEATSPWPVDVSTSNATTGNKLSSPVYDSGSGLVFVGSASGTSASSGGRLHSIDSTGTVVSSGQLASYSNNSARAGVSDAPIVDTGAQRVYAFVGSDAGGTSSRCNTAPCSAVYQFPTDSSIAGHTTPKVQVGRGVTSATAGFLYAGAFDDAYYNSAVPASPNGHLYVCGSDGAAAQRPTLWQIPIIDGAMRNPVPGPSLVSGNADCSPVTEILNPATTPPNAPANDYLYASVTASGNDTGCTGACIYMFNLTGLTWNASAVADTGLQAPGGTSGIIVDNISPMTGASQVYYSTLGAAGAPGNAIQASQAGLQ